MATDAENTAADRVNQVSDWNKSSVNLNLNWMNDLYDQSDKQNKALLDTEKRQNRQKTEVDRFQAQRSLQNAARGLNNTVGAGLNSSATGNLADMFRDQQDSDNVDYWNTLRQNQNTVDNAYQEALNQNYLSRREAAVNAEIAKRDIEANQAAQLQNINPDLYVSPSENAAYSTRDLSGRKIGSYDTAVEAINSANANRDKNNNSRAQQSGYATTATGRPAATIKSSPLNDYFTRLLRGM